ncbi:MAG: hypothetical protein KC417_10520 [Myxococcales bacterium]|nr:hypothetical protein [Myxococcales bacterium]
MRCWWPTGPLAVEGAWVSGLRSAEWRHYDRHGTLIRTEQYDPDGRLSHAIGVEGWREPSY